MIILDQIAMASYFIWHLCYDILESALDCFASHINSAKLQQLTLGYAVFQGPEVPLTFVIITHTTALIKKVKACGPSQWSTLANGMSYLCLESVSIKKPHDKRWWTLSLSCLTLLHCFRKVDPCSKKPRVPVSNVGQYLQA